MLGVLQAILCAIQNLALSILAVIIMAANAIIAALATLLAGFLLLMPDMPDVPTWPGWAEDGLGWTAWFFPVGTVIDVLAFLLVAWLAWQALALALRWAKAIDS